MPTPRLPRDLQEKVLKALAEGKKHRTIERELKVSAGAISRIKNDGIKAAEIRQPKPVAPKEEKSAPPKREEVESQTFKDEGSTWEIKLPKTEAASLEEFLDLYKVDRLQWSVESFEINRWEMASVPRATGSDKEGWERPSTEPVVTPLYQIKAKLKKRKEVADFLAEIQLIKQEAHKWAPRPKPIVRANTRDSGNILEIAIPDLHLGKLAWSEETGYQNYDAKIAEETFYRALETILERTKAFRFDWILFPVGNDLLQADSDAGETANKTRVDTDSRYKKTFSRARVMIATAIERLRQIAPVKIVMMPGNHDRNSIWFLGEILQAQFVNYSDVEIDNRLPNRKYYEHGVNLIGYSHGDKGKINDYPLTMAVEASEMWHGKKFREMHVGHKHTSKSDEFHGVKVRTFSALCPPDYWHASENYAGNIRSAVGIAWNDKEGPVAEVSYHEDAYQPISIPS